MPTKKKDDTIVVESLKRQTGVFTIRGMTGMYTHRMSAKAKHQLMVGGRKKTTAEKQVIKHNPYEEFLESMHVEEGFHENSHVMFPAMAIKAAMATSALVTAGITKADVQRLIYLPDEMIPLFGTPKLRMDITRSADINRTPDVRTRAYFSDWATQVRITWIEPQLNARAVASLLNNAGLICGIGDYRQEKGKGNYGTFEIIDAEDIPDELLDADAQWEAIQNPMPDNLESRTLLKQYDEEVISRSQTTSDATKPKRKTTNKKAA